MSEQLRPVDGDDPSTKVQFNPIVPKLVIELEGMRGEFHAHAKPNNWVILKNAKAARESEKQGNAAQRLANYEAMVNLALSSVVEDERDRFEDFMTEHGHDEDLVEKLGDAMNALWAGETRLPLVPTSWDSSASTSGSGSTSTDDLPSLVTDEGPTELNRPETDQMTGGTGSSIQASTSEPF